MYSFMFKFEWNACIPLNLSWSGITVSQKMFDSQFPRLLELDGINCIPICLYLNGITVFQNA